MNINWPHKRAHWPRNPYSGAPKMGADHCAHVVLYYRRWMYLLRPVPYTEEAFAFFSAAQQARIYSYFQE